MIESCTLRKVKNGINIRTDEVYGIINKLPHVGHSFRMVAPPLVGGTVRVITTSAVTKIVKTNGKFITFDTLNSTYKIEVDGLTLIRKLCYKIKCAVEALRMMR